MTKLSDQLHYWFVKINKIFPTVLLRFTSLHFTWPHLNKATGSPKYITLRLTLPKVSCHHFITPYLTHFTTPHLPILPQITSHHNSLHISQYFTTSHHMSLYLTKLDFNSPHFTLLHSHHITTHCAKIAPPLPILSLTPPISSHFSYPHHTLSLST